MEQIIRPEARWHTKQCHHYLYIQCKSLFTIILKLHLDCGSNPKSAAHILCFVIPFLAPCTLILLQHFLYIYIPRVQIWINLETTFLQLNYEYNYDKRRLGNWKSNLCLHLKRLKLYDAETKQNLWRNCFFEYYFCRCLFSDSISILRP